MARIKIGISNFHYAELVKDDSTGISYKKPVHVPNLVSLTLDHTTNSVTFHADNQPIEVATTYGGTKTSVEMAEVPLDVQAALLGHQYQNGVVKRNANDKAPYVAIMYEELLSDSTKKYVKMYKGMFRIPKDEGQTKKDNVEFKSTTIEADFVSLAYNGAIDDEAYSGVAGSENVIANWYEYVDSSATTVADSTPSSPNLSVSPATLTLNAANSYSSTVTVTRSGNGTISASSSSDKVTYGISGTTITVNGDSTGLTENLSATLTVNVAADGTSYSSGTTSVSVTVVKGE